MKSSEKKRVAILGSTGSIGTQALDVISCHPEKFEVAVLTAYNNVDLLIKQAVTFVPKAVVIGCEDKYLQIKEALANYPIDVMAGSDAIAEVVKLNDIDIVLTAMVGYSGLLPTINAIKAGKDIALANKETLVVAGELIMQLASDNNVKILPVDSEHSAVFQCLQGEQHTSVEKIILTASGGPFFGKDAEYLKKVTKKEALKHPCWDMGAKVTIDSATLMNKGLEVIEAKWLFGVTPDQIDVVVHRQSIIHSMVQFSDSSIKAQMGLPDMRLPILYALGYPERLSSTLQRFDFTQYPSLTFGVPDTQNFRNLALAFQVLREGGNRPCVLNAANEIVVEAFLKDKIGFFEMSDIIEQTLEKIPYISAPDYETYKQTNQEAMNFSRTLIKA
ncbi:MAG: 1-deoxy-D-xylulose-5-phosphate reductoisomerase [Bacteroidota bacterium]|nr:1-deoxy-D-xylulose-5-phosphate reductoisomerase [Bacteroidota bacterium]